ncbi:hypothetical protein FRB97_009430 [Tulasnella sp. 331]|nr:hypothetical protein FRB97_009430 [Tulasnella sp. 331]
MPPTQVAKVPSPEDRCDNDVDPDVKRAHKAEILAIEAGREALEKRLAPWKDARSPGSAKNNLVKKEKSIPFPGFQKREIIDLTLE